MTNRRHFLMGLGRFALGAAAAMIVKPPVLYSFPTDIRIATPAEVEFLELPDYALAYRFTFSTLVPKNFELRRSMPFPEGWIVG